MATDMNHFRTVFQGLAEVVKSGRIEVHSELVVAALERLLQLLAFQGIVQIRSIRGISAVFMLD